MGNSKKTPPAKTYAERVQELENEGLTTSDAQGVADVELQRGLLSDELPENNHSHLVEEALDAFWNVIVEAYPLAKTGDLSPLVTVQFQNAAEDAVKEWIANNA